MTTKADVVRQSLLTHAMLNPGSSALHVSPTWEVARHNYLAFRQFIRDLMRAGHVKRADGAGFEAVNNITNRRFTIEFTNGSTIRFGPVSPVHQYYGCEFQRIDGTDDPVLRSRIRPYRDCERDNIAHQWMQNSMACGRCGKPYRHVVDEAAVFTRGHYTQALDRLDRKMAFARMYGAGPHTLSRILQEDKGMKDTQLTKDVVRANKFYVGSKAALSEIYRPHLGKSGTWGHPDLAAATEHATQLMDEQNGEPQFIVKIVRVVRRRKPPVAIEDVK